MKMVPKVSLTRKVYDVLLDASLQIRKIANLPIQRDVCTLRVSSDIISLVCVVDRVLIKIQYCA